MAGLRPPDDPPEIWLDGWDRGSSASESDILCSEGDHVLTELRVGGLGNSRVGAVT
jgi:hypothetical protein